MYEIRFAEGYEKRAVKFFKKHREIYPQYKKTITLLAADPSHPSLRVHKLHGRLEGYSSVSINIKYRIIVNFIIVDGVIVLIDIGSHDAVYRD